MCSGTKRITREQKVCFLLISFRTLAKRRTVTVQRPGPNLAADIPTILSFFVCCCLPVSFSFFILFGDTVLLVPLFQFLFCQRASDSPYLDPRAPHLHQAAHHYHHCPPPDPTRSALPSSFAVFLSRALSDLKPFRGRLLLSFLG